MGSDKYERSKFCCNPAGGSFVILTPFCKNETGNTVDG